MIHPSLLRPRPRVSLELAMKDLKAELRAQYFENAHFWDGKLGYRNVDEFIDASMQTPQVRRRIADLVAAAK